MSAQRVFQRIVLYCLTLLLIYPSSPHIFKRLMAIKERVFISPLCPKDEIRVRCDAMGSGYFNTRRSGGRRHKGLDIAGTIGQPVYAAKSGIAHMGEIKRGMGKYVTISHLDGYKTVYGHLSCIAVPDKNWIWQGQKIGEVGKTGNANYTPIQPHLHLEIKKSGRALDPYLFIKKDRPRR